MPAIDFYILEEASNLKSQHFACRLLEDLHQHNEKIYIHTSTRDEAERLDTLLWTFKEDSFLPHNLYDPADEFPPAIQIGCKDAPKDHQHILLNLDRSVPSFYTQFQRVIEIVFSDPNVQQLARDRFKYYRDNGCNITTHKIKANDV